MYDFSSLSTILLTINLKCKWKVFLFTIGNELNYTEFNHIANKTKNIINWCEYYFCS